MILAYSLFPWHNTQIECNLLHNGSEKKEHVNTMRDQNWPEKLLSHTLIHYGRM